MKMKYIRHEDQGFILWPRISGDPVWHSDMAAFVSSKCESNKIISAGFVRFVDGFPECYDMSGSLGICAHSDDSILLADQLGIYP